MTFKDDIRRKTGAFLTSSQEIFEKIFAQATRELKIKRKPKPAGPKPARSPSPEAPRTAGKSPKVAVGSEKSVLTYKTSEKVKASPKPRPKVEATPRKGARLLRAGLLFVLLLVLAGYAANYFAIIDLAGVADSLGLGPKQVVQAPIPRKLPAKPQEKPVTSPKPSQPQEKVPTTPPAPSEPPPPAVSKEEKLVELETPTTIAQAPPGKGRIEEKAPTVTTREQPKPPEVAPKEELQPLPVQTQVSEKPTAPNVAPFRPSAPQYPYSVYLGSFKAPEAVKKALSDYQEKGLSAYWARVELGDKGVWFRFFTGYFQTKEEAERFIRNHNLQGATPGLTRYANLIGIYSSDNEVEDIRKMIESAGFYPYVIKEPSGKSYLYSGAFDRKEYAEKERGFLASKGIKSETTER